MVDRHTFAHRLWLLGLKKVRFAAIVGLQADTVYRWSDDSVPAWAIALVVSWEQLQAVHGKAWLARLTDGLAAE